MQYIHLLFNGQAKPGFAAQVPYGHTHTEKIPRFNDRHVKTLGTDARRDRQAKSWFTKSANGPFLCRSAREKRDLTWDEKCNVRYCKMSHS
jgi:hypothetical protein